MMQQQTHDFIHGYLFNEIERKIAKDLANRGSSIGLDTPNTFTAQVPLLWFGIKRPFIVPSTSPVTAIADAIAKKLDVTLKDVFTKKVFQTVVIRDKQYFRFVTTVTTERRELTVSQIEDLLGYKVTIVSEDDK